MKNINSFFERYPNRLKYQDLERLDELYADLERNTSFREYTELLDEMFGEACKEQKVCILKKCSNIIDRVFEEF